MQSKLFPNIILQLVNYLKRNPSLIYSRVVFMGTQCTRHAARDLNVRGLYECFVRRLRAPSCTVDGGLFKRNTLLGNKHRSLSQRYRSCVWYSSYGRFQASNAGYLLKKIRFAHIFLPIIDSKILLRLYHLQAKTIVVGACT